MNFTLVILIALFAAIGLFVLWNELRKSTTDRASLNEGLRQRLKELDGKGPFSGHRGN